MQEWPRKQDASSRLIQHDNLVTLRSPHVRGPADVPACLGHIQARPGDCRGTTQDDSSASQEETVSRHGWMNPLTACSTCFSSCAGTLSRLPSATTSVANSICFLFLMTSSLCSLTSFARKNSLDRNREEHPK